MHVRVDLGVARQDLRGVDLHVVLPGLVQVGEDDSPGQPFEHGSENVVAMRGPMEGRVGNDGRVDVFASGRPQRGLDRGSQMQTAVGPP